MRLLLAVLSVLAWGASAPAGAPTSQPTTVISPTDWNVWRQRQRRELAPLPKPADPPGEAGVHPIDRWLADWWAKEKVQPSILCDDATFCRRAYFDLIGLPPTETDMQQFLVDTGSDKRARLIDALLADNPAYAEGWMAWWCDLLRNDEQTSIDGLRKPITKWLFAALLNNMPYDRMVAELVNPGNDGPDGYLKGINWRGRVNASQRPPVQAAQNVGQVFMATNIKCASCHDHFTRPYLLDDSYGLASFFSDENLEVYRCDVPTGHVIPPRFPIRGLGEVAENADRATRGKAVAEMLTTPRNPRFAKAMANRMWKRLMGRGLFEPVDDIYAKPSNPELLDWLAYEFMRQDYDLKQLIRLLMTSQAYQLASHAESADQIRASAKAPGVFTGPPIRRLGSEQFADAVSRLTGHWPQVAVMDVHVDNANIRAWRHKVPDPLAMALGRPLREQVTTCREEDASMLQMLELVNGKVLTALLAEGATKLLASPLGDNPDSIAVLDVLCMRAYGRKATDVEREVLGPMLGTPEKTRQERQAGWEDVCWTLVMNPEFQFIY